MGKLSKEKLDEFLKETKILAKLATVTPEGEPYVVPVWYEWNGEEVYIVSKPAANFVKHLKFNPKAALCVENQVPPYVRVLVQGIVEIRDADHDWLPLGYRMARRFLGEIEGDRYIEKTKNWKRVLLTLKPARIISWDGGKEGHEWHRKTIDVTEEEGAV